MTKILFFINTLGVGGAESVLVETVNSLDKEKYDITVQTITDTGPCKQKLAPHIRYKSIIRCKNPVLYSIWIQILFRLCGAKFMYRFFVKEDYDYEIAFLEGWPTKVISCSTNRKGKKIAWVHTDLCAFPDSYRAYGSEQKEENAYRKFDKVFCVSECARLALKKKYNLDESRLGVVYNIIDEQAIREKAKEEIHLKSVTRPVFISVGRLIPQKGYERLLRIHRRLIHEGLSHTLLILGDGPQREMLDRYICENNLSDTARLLGYQPNPHKYVSKADVFICSSVAEGYSTAVTEAVICGVPVVSTDVAGAREPWDAPRCSIIIDNDEDALYHTLKELLAHPEKLETLRQNTQQRISNLTKKHLVAEFERKVFL